MEKINLTDEELKEFNLESHELLDACEDSLLKVEGGEAFATHYDSIFRAFHTIKGAAGMLGLTKLQSHVHELESKLIEIRGKIPDKATIEWFLRGCDGTKQLLDGKEIDVQCVEAQSPEDQIPGEFFSESDELIFKIENYLNLTTSLADDENLTQSLYREMHTLKGILQLYGFQSEGELTHSMEAILDAVRNKQDSISDERSKVMLEALDLVAGSICAKKENRPSGNEEKIKLSIKKLANAPLEVKVEKELPMSQIAIPEIETQTTSDKNAASADGANTIRVSVNLLDNLMRLMGEMVLVRNQVIQFSSKNDDLEFLNLSQRLDIVTSEIQGEVMKTRMQPIGNILSKFNRVVRDLAKELNKKINLTLEGMETELDKSLLEMIKDPLMHIVRNSCDHGIETTESRKSSGKEEEGHIAIRAYHEGGQVVIEIKDDGKGLDQKRIIAKALEKGLVTQDKVSSMSEKDINMMIFAPGFSTAATVSNVSGRGVGMDVVKTNIEKIGGIIDLATVSGRGTTLKLKIPLTLAIIPAMLIKSMNQRYAIPQVKLLELVRIEKGKSSSQIEMLQGNAVLRLRGSLLPLLGLGGILEGKQENFFEQDISNIVVLNADNQAYGLIVDEILDTADIVVKPLSRFLKSVPFYSGATVLGDGSVSLILDVAGLAAQGFSSDSKREENEKMQQKHEDKDTNEVQEFLLFRLNHQSKFALPLGLVHRLEEFQVKDIEYSGSQPVVQYRNTLLPIISLNKYFHFDAASENQSKVISAIVLKKGDRLYGFHVNEILDVNSTTATFDDSTTDRDGLMGNIVVNGEMVTVVDTLNILDQSISKLTKTSNATSHKVAVKKIRNQKILLVEDTAFFRKQISKVLVKHGYDVITKENGEEALQWLESNTTGGLPVDIILSDIEMPKMNGWELAKKLRRNSEFRTVPLLALTTRFSQEDVQKGIECGFDVYLEKLNEDLLIENLQKFQNLSQMTKVS